MRTKTLIEIIKKNPKKFTAAVIAILGALGYNLEPSVQEAIDVILYAVVFSF